MKALYDKVSQLCSKTTTQQYSTSFSLGIKFLDKKFHVPIYGIYGFVRLADEIVDSFHAYDKALLLQEFRADTYKAIKMGISLNPILNSFQQVVNDYGIERALIDTFLDSMEMDLHQHYYSRQLYEKYILGSAEVVGLMCLRVFCERNSAMYESLKYPAMKLGAAFQKINFLRDARADSFDLGRTYFPGIDLNNFSNADKKRIENEINEDFAEAYEGICRLPLSSRKGVYLAYTYYMGLFQKIKNLPPQKILSERVRIPDGQKLAMTFQSVLKLQLNIL